MKKYLIRTALVLAAITACNKEVEAPAVDNGQEEVTPGKVTLTFTAAISEETRTAYAGDKTASWVDGDAISVCVTNGSAYEVDTFTYTTNNGGEFTGQVTSGYTTIVSGVYPADANHVFTNGAVASVYLPDTYNLGTANDTGRYIPMVGEMVHDNDNNTDTFTFHHICGALKVTITDIFDKLSFTTNGEIITGSFPLVNNRIAIQSTGSQDAITFTYTRSTATGDRNLRTFYIPIPVGTLSAGASVELTNATNSSVVYGKTTTSSIDLETNYLQIKRFPQIDFTTPDGWSISVDELGTDNKPIVTYTAPSGTKFIKLAASKATFTGSTYKGSVAKFVEERLANDSGYPTFTGTATSTFSNDISSYENKDYVLLMCGVDSDRSDRKFTFDYCKLEHTFSTSDYRAWLGEWRVDDENNIDTWTITRKETNKTYNVTGLCGNTNNPKKVEASITTSGKLRFKSQFDFATATFSGVPYQVSLVMYSTGPIYNSYQLYNMMEAAITNDGTTLSSLQSNFSKYNLVRRETHTSSVYNYGSVRNLPASMTKQQ